MPGMTICIVDDDSSVRRAVSRLLESFSLSVETFASAEEIDWLRRSFTGVPSRSVCGGGGAAGLACAVGAEDVDAGA